jgi:hypothetical protein
MGKKVNKMKAFDFSKRFWENELKFGLPGQRIRPKRCFIGGESQLVKAA